MSSYNGVRGENAADGFRIRSTLSRTPCAGLPDCLQRYTQSEDAEDVLPNVFLKLIRREFPPDLKKNPKGYFYRAALNAALDLVRARQRDALTGEAERFVNAVPQDPEFAEEAERRLYDAIATLHPTAVQILMLRYVHNHSLSQIATLLGTTRSIVAVSLFRSASGCESLFAPLEQSHEAQKRKSLRAFEPLSWPILQSLERTDPIGRRSRSSALQTQDFSDSEPQRQNQTRFIRNEGIGILRPFLPASQRCWWL
jgi:RNA polymerase sigma factor (sigma-70 family)